jgi:hypothetical protein
MKKGKSASRSQVIMYILAVICLIVGIVVYLTTGKDTKDTIKFIPFAGAFILFLAAKFDAFKLAKNEPEELFGK